MKNIIMWSLITRSTYRTREADKEIIDDYLRIADTEFVKYKNSLLEMLDSDTFSTEEKVILLIYLCIIEKDFQSITEMG